jgi:hypothetical protein
MVSVIAVLLSLEVPARCRACGHEGTVLAGQLVKLSAAAATDRLDDVAVLVANLPVITKMGAVAAGRAEGARIGEKSLPRMRRSDLMLKHVGIALREVWGSHDHFEWPS